MKDGKINDTKFKKYVAKRVTRGVNSVAGGVAGGIIGQMIIPVPVLGAVVFYLLKVLKYINKNFKICYIRLAP